MSARRGILWVAAGALCLALVAAWVVWRAFSPLTYQGPNDAFSLRYPRQWAPADTGGIVTFHQKDQPPGVGTTVTLVLSRAEADWAGDFEGSLARAFASVGGDYHFLDKKTVPLPAGNTNRYAYSIAMDGNRLKNIVYVFVLGAQTAAVMTCSAPLDHDAGLEQTCAAFAEAFRVGEP